MISQYSNDKVIAHNTFAIPVLTPTFDIIKWIKDELEQIDVKTRKILSCNGSFHVNSDINRLYTKRNKGGRGLNSIADVYIARIISISRHLTIPNKNEKLTNEWLKKGNLSSHIEGYICAIQEEEINTRYLKSKRNNNINPICRLCKQQNETIQHVVASCPFISASMYLPFRHDKVAYIIYKC